MRSKNLIQSLVAFSCLFSIASCEKETEEFKTEAIADYLPLTVGKYITYRLDSTVFTNFQRTIEIHKYQVKHLVEAQVPDNLGRPSYRIVRYLRDSAGTSAWVENGTYFITPLSDQVEVIEDNLRFIKLHLPFKLNTDWKGNKYIADRPYASLYTFSNDVGMDGWDYNMEKFDETIALGGQPVKDVYTIFQIDESMNAPVTDYKVGGWRTLGTEQYAKNIGLVSRDYILWEYQPNTSGVGIGPTSGFGIKMWMIDHN